MRPAPRRTWMPARPVRSTGAPSTQVGGAAHSTAPPSARARARDTAGIACRSPNTRSWTGTHPRARSCASMAAYASSTAGSTARVAPGQVTRVSSLPTVLVFSSTSTLSLVVGM